MVIPRWPPSSSWSAWRWASSSSSSAGSARARSSWCRSSLLGLLVVEATIYANPEHAAARHLPPGLGLDAAAAARDLHHAGADRPAHRAREAEADRPAGRLSGWPSPPGWPSGRWRGSCTTTGCRRIIYEAKDILYIVGAYALAAGVPVRRYFDSGDLLQARHLARRLRLDRRPHDDRQGQRQHQSAPAPAAGFRCGRLGDGGPLPRHRHHVLPAAARSPDPSSCATSWLWSRCWSAWCSPTSAPSW